LAILLSGCVLCALLLGCNSEKKNNSGDYKLVGQMLLVGGTLQGEDYTLTGGAISGAHRAQTQTYRLKGRLLP
jgi:hypothetical protein